jgi:hypothetical protein
MKKKKEHKHMDIKEDKKLIHAEIKKEEHKKGHEKRK